MPGLGRIDWSLAPAATRPLVVAEPGGRTAHMRWGNVMDRTAASLPGPAFVNPRLLTPHPPADWPAHCFVMFAEQSHPDKLRRRLIQHHNNAVSRLVYSVLSTVRVQALPTCSRLASPGDPMRAQVRVKRSFQPFEQAVPALRRPCCCRFGHSVPGQASASHHQCVHSLLYTECVV